ncbi:MAG: hypothetical protein HY300_12980 [Verrucomicrobia bacterium]|nr:hypothetical protein [Verrucomicrobiota bacterium]
MAALTAARLDSPRAVAEPAAPMKSNELLRYGVIAFVAALMLYAVLYPLDRHLRLRKGPWRVTFATDASGVPSLVIAEPGLGIADVRLNFPGEQAAVSNVSTTVVFDQPKPPLPFGEFIFDDLMYLPGTVVFNVCGHGVQLLPRALLVDHREFAWKSGLTLELSPTNKNPYLLPKK